MEKWLSLWSAGQKKTVEDMTAIREAGFDGVEIWAEHLTAENDMELAKAAGLKIGLHLPFHDLNLATPFEEVESLIFKINEQWLKKLQEYGGGHAVIHGGMAWASEGHLEAKEVVIDRLSRMQKMAEELSCTLLFENQIPDKLNYTHIYPSSVDEWLEMLDESGTAACLDTGHLAVLGASLEETISRLGNRLASVHFSDNDAEGDLHQLPGDGVTGTSTAKLVDLLQEHDYNGPIVFEINPYLYSLQDIIEHPSAK
ncbi:sugar phosphate isomerase/epimerase [Sporosarcina sp. Sa2YVA2]|uniref:Sugar phosphate isomerase/epimerase n=1 Tax=Sporosarcina quadrami TaxID=2762234 RepID=A0ABR8U8Z7_9BACL|nr:sugar phosphate isomerase/epimerase family protein [Sporosarcina quadrami]MBD7984503.1 sugar phosphate isomerase/epimerase [Sporosarcina quadrami]